MKAVVIKNIMLFVFSLLFFFGCDKSSNINDDDTIYGSGKMVSQTREVDECSGLTIQNVGNVYLTQDDNQSIRIEADDNIIEDIITRKENNKLSVGLKDGSYSNVTIKVYVSLKTICSLLINGAGSIEVQNSILCDTLGCSISGAGNISLQGSTNFFNCSVNGSGNITAKDFISKKCKAIVNGAGNLTIYVSEELNASVNGMGTIIYYGNPPVVNTSVSGFGQIIRK